MLNNDLDKGLVTHVFDDTFLIGGKEVKLEAVLSRMLGTIRRHAHTIKALADLTIGTEPGAPASEMTKTEMVFSEDEVKDD